MRHTMYRRMGVIFLISIWAWVTPVRSVDSGPTGDSQKLATGLLEVDCNIAGIHLHLCPRDNYLQKEVKVFFGLITSIKRVCSSEEIFVGETPLKPTAVPAGRYTLLIPTDYVWEGEGPVELTILPGEKTYFLLKLFSSRANHPESDYGGGGGGGGGGGAR